VDSLRNQYYTTLATEGRLLAERDGLSKVTFSPVFEQLQAQPRVAEIIALQPSSSPRAVRGCKAKSTVINSRWRVCVSS
jgi:hypothetical protein